jgi:RecQ-mediated genome instability protein 1
MSNPAGGVGIEPDGPLAADLKAALARKGLYPSTEWLRTFLATQRPTTPISALASTASFRILAGDITCILSRANTPAFPPDIHTVTVKERSLPAGAMVVQILDIEDMGRSRWEQIEAIEAIERGEGTKGRQIIRVGMTEENGQEAIAAISPSNTVSGVNDPSKGPHKVLLQDAAGSTAYGIELKRVEGLGLNMSIGAKLLLKGCPVGRGVILLEPTTVSWLGGKIDAIHQGWMAGKKQRLLAAIEAHATNWVAD